MRSQTGFARLRPLAVLTGLAAGTIALVASARQVQSPRSVLETPVATTPGGSVVANDATVPERADRPEGRELVGKMMPHLRGLDLRGADLREMDLSGVDLRGANLAGADLYHSSLDGVRLRRANLRGAFCGYNTNWPDGFNPRAHGARPFDYHGNEVR